MKLSAPTVPVWWIAVIVGVLGIISHFTPIPQITPYQFWMVCIGFILLVVATLFRKV